MACCIFALFLVLFSAPSISAQTAGTISGHVADTTGAVIPGATITLTNTATNTSRTTVSTGAGDYTIPDVMPGVYNIQATHSGFKTTTTPDVQVAVQQSLALNFTLSVGAVSQSVTVAATGTLLQVENPTLGTVVENQAITQLPLNGENYLSLVELSANANTLSPQASYSVQRLGGSRGAETISVGGSRVFFDYYTLDGVDNTDVDFNTFVVQPTIDAIQEMKVETGVYPAQFGYNATQVNVVTKSGGNQYHGTAFEFLRNNYADALGYDYTTIPLPPVLPYKYNDYGFVLDGPITIPHVYHGQNKFFFMVSDEWYSQISYGQGTATLPATALLGGDFSQYTTSQGGSVIPIYDPATGNPTTGVGKTQFECNGVLNVICPGRIDPISALVLKDFYNTAQTSAFTNNYAYTTLNTDKHDSFTARGDYYQSAKLQFAFRFSNGSETDNSTGFPSPFAPTGTGIVTNFYQYMVSNTWTISPTIVNVATFGDTDFYNSLGTTSAALGIDPVAQLNIPGLEPGIQSNWGIPDFTFAPDRWTGIGDSSSSPFTTADPDVSVNDNISLVKGKQSFDLGFHYDRQTFNELGNQFSRGSFAFMNNATAELSAPATKVPNTGTAFADFLLGDIYQGTYAVAVADANYVRNVEAAYFDDNYKLTPKLSFQAGLRYELTPPWYDTMGNEFIVNMTANNTPISPTLGTAQPQSDWPFFTREGNCTNPYQGVNVEWVGGGAPGTASGAPVQPAPQCANGNFPNTLMETDYTNWAPRIGISYSPTPTWVIRAGYGMYYNHDIANARFDMARNLAGDVRPESPTGVPTVFYSNVIGSGGSIADIAPPFGYAMQYDHKTSNTQVYLLDVQKQFGQNWSLETGYMGTLSRNLWGLRDANWPVPYGYIGNGAPTSVLSRTPYPNYGVIQFVHDIGYGNYNAFSFKVTKRYSDGLNIVGSYTYSKSLDDTSGVRTQQSPIDPQDARCIPCEYGSSDFDVRHRVVASVLYDLPIGQGKLLAPKSRIVDAAVGGWQVSTIATFQTGTPFIVGENTNNADTGLATTYDRPNMVPGVSWFEAHRTVGSTGRWLNPAAFQVANPGFLGDESRNMIYGPGYENYDMALHKAFNMPYNGHHQLQIRFEVFNALNHTNFGIPDSTVTVPSTFGEILGSNGAARELQLAAKYVF